MAGNLKGDGNVYNPMSSPIPGGLSDDEVAQIQEQAISYSADIKFHQSFILPPNPPSGRHESLRITYADAGFSQSDASLGEQIPVLLWCGGMFGGRFQAVAYDEEARRHRVRILAVDKPGIGGTGKVPLEQRISTWLDIVPALLKHLSIQHVSLASHSNGALYILNTLLHQRELLDPERPFVALFAPWVLPSHSGKHHLTLLQSLPSPLLGTWHHLARFVNTTIAPLRSQQSSTGTPPKKHPGPISQTISLVPSSSKSISPSNTITSSLHTQASQSILESLLTKYIFLESIDGASQEVLLCLQKGNRLWGTWKDYDDLVPLVRANEEQRILVDNSSPEEPPHSPPPPSSLPVVSNSSKPRRHSPLRVQCFFASADELVGTKGQVWFERCWKTSPSSSSSTTSFPNNNNNNKDDDPSKRDEGSTTTHKPNPTPKADADADADINTTTTSNDHEESIIDFTSATMPNTNHNNLLPVERGGIGEVLRFVSRM